MIETRFGRLLIVQEVARKEYVLKDGRVSKARQMQCICDCGKTALVILSNLKSGRQKSCGCLHAEVAGNSARTHGMRKSPEYAIWCAIKRRCYNKNSADYVWYGARGIAMCDSWRNSFEAFYADMGPRPEGMSIDRIDCDGDYSPDNCRWTSMKEQQNNRRNCRHFTHNGRTQTIKQWAEESGIRYATLWHRLMARGMHLADALAMG